MGTEANKTTWFCPVCFCPIRTNISKKKKPNISHWEEEKDFVVTYCSGLPVHRWSFHSFLEPNQTYVQSDIKVLPRGGVVCPTQTQCKKLFINMAVFSVSSLHLFLSEIFIFIFIWNFFQIPNYHSLSVVL